MLRTFGRQAKDYPDLDVENCYRVTEVTDEGLPVRDWAGGYI